MSSIRYEKGDLSDEETVLNWLIEQKSADTIEELTDELVETIIQNNEYVVVFFSNVQCPVSCTCEVTVTVARISRGQKQSIDLT